MYNYVLTMYSTGVYAYYNMLKRIVSKGELNCALKAKSCSIMSLSPKFDYKTIKYACNILGHTIIAKSNTPITKKTNPELFI